MIQQWGVVPLFGNQPLDYGMIVRVTMARNVYEAVRRVRRAIGADIHKIPPDQWSLFEWLVENGFTQ